MKNKKLQTVILLLAILSLLWGCGANSAGSQDVYYRAEDSMSAMAPNVENSNPSAGVPNMNKGTTTAVLPEGRKLIRKVTIEAQTKDMDTLLPEIEQQVGSLGGYLENREMYTGSNASSQWRTARLTIRIPSDKADQFLNQFKNAANVVSLNENLTDVTLDYVATESRIKALRTEEARLLELMDQAKTLSELLEVEARLTDVISELEAVESQLRLYDNMIDYTSIQLSIRQVTELSTPEDEMTIWQRISSGFMSTLTGLCDTLVDLFVWLIVSSPVLAVLSLVAFAVYNLIRFIKKRKSNQSRNAGNS